VESNDFFLRHLRAAPVIAVLRGAGAEDAVRTAEASWQAGVVLIEVSRSHDEAFEAVRAVCERARALARIAGAGTVSRGPMSARPYQPEPPSRLRLATRRPPQTQRAAQLPYLPGVATPSEVQAAIGDGFSTLRKGTGHPVRFFQIEHTTSVYSSLLRFNDVISNITLQVSPPLVISSDEIALLARGLETALNDVADAADKSLASEQASR
jgi:hypothetical protein